MAILSNTRHNHSPSSPKRPWEKFFETREQSFLRWKYENRPKSDGVPLYDALAKIIVGPRVLDVGCASCIMYPLLPGMQYVGLDFTKKFLEHAEKLYPEIKVHHGSVLSLPFPSRSFDTVFCKSLLEHIHPDDWPKALSEMLRVASKQLAIGFFRPPGKEYRWYQRGGSGELYVTYKKDDLLKIIEGYPRFQGLKIQHCPAGIALATYDITLGPCES